MDERALVPGVVTHLACKAELAVQRIRELVGAAGVDLLVSGGWLAGWMLGTLGGWMLWKRGVRVVGGCEAARLEGQEEGWLGGWEAKYWTRCLGPFP
jgi:hypothetical protein